MLPLGPQFVVRHAGMHHGHARGEALEARLRRAPFPDGPTFGRWQAETALTRAKPPRCTRRRRQKSNRWPNDLALRPAPRRPSSACPALADQRGRLIKALAGVARGKIVETLPDELMRVNEWEPFVSGWVLNSPLSAARAAPSLVAGPEPRVCCRMHGASWSEEARPPCRHRESTITGRLHGRTRRGAARIDGLFLLFSSNACLLRVRHLSRFSYIFFQSDKRASRSCPASPCATRGRSALTWSCRLAGSAAEHRAAPVVRSAAPPGSARLRDDARHVASRSSVATRHGNRYPQQKERQVKLQQPLTKVHLKTFKLEHDSTSKYQKFLKINFL